MKGPVESKRICDVLRDEIAAGTYRIGGLLPNLEALMARFDAGEYAVRRALRQLRSEGLVTIRRHVGVIVNDKSQGAWRGCVAFIAVRMSGSYFAQILELQFSRRFAAAGYSLIPVFLDPDANRAVNIEALKRPLANGLSFAICHCLERQVTDLLDSAGVPYVVVNGFTKDFPNARAVIRDGSRRCYADLIKAMSAAGVRTVLELDLERRIDRSFKIQLRNAGIATNRIMYGSLAGYQRIGDVKKLGHRMVETFFADEQHRAHPPDAILFDDDYLAFGGIVAILEAGLRIPDDIRVVSFSNRGNEPALGVTLARIENDPAAYGDAVADYVLALLAGRNPRPPRIEYRFVPGESLGRG